MVYDSRFARPSLALMTLKALSPTDGRYAGKVDSLREILSEYGLIRYRVLVEVRWLQSMAENNGIGELTPLTAPVKNALNGLVENFSAVDAEQVKKIEAVTNHDVKAVEYFIREKLADTTDVGNLGEFIHFGCTSEDINNLAYGLMLQSARDDVLVPGMRALAARLGEFANDHAELPMLSRTHGQTASPTTVGKEFANVVARINIAQERFSAVTIRGKFNGAVGNFNAHIVAYPP